MTQSERPDVALLSRQNVSNAAERRADQGASTVLATAAQRRSAVSACPWGGVFTVDLCGWGVE